MSKREQSPMKGQTPSRDNIFCTSCRFRDRTTVNAGKEVIPVGVTRDTCEIFKYPNIKTSAILFNGEPCPYYQPEG